MSKGIFVTFEGPDGCGKSTQIQLLFEWLGSIGRDVLLTREPGGTDIGEKIREVIKSVDNFKKICPLAEVMLFEACRAQHVVEKIAPAVAAGNVVLCDRFIDSSSVYQGIGRNIGIDVIDFLNKVAIGKCIPDLTFILDIPAECSLARIARRGGGCDRIEREGVEFFNTVRAGYLNLARTDKRFFVIDGTRSLDGIAQQIRDEFSARFY